ncbi:MAG TPA: hypothetical protein PLB62_03440 [Candidatus Sumerlaeota bacterium]|nr:hypothetical protein [Candidatus Sumerlaeota bacterium]
MIIPYEAGVFLVECIVIALVLKPGVFKSLYLSFVANLVSWVAGTGVSLVSMLVSMAIHGWNPRKEVSYIIWAAAGQCFFLFMNAAVEMKIISEIGRIPMNRRLIRTVFYMNLATWAVGMWIFSELVKSG